MLNKDNKKNKILKEVIMKFKLSVLSLLVATIPSISHAELTITDESGNVITVPKNQTIDNSVILFDKTQNPTPNTNPSPVQSNNGEVVITDTPSSSTASGDGDSSDLSPEEIQSIQSSGGTIVSTGAAKNKSISKGYGDKVTAGIPNYYSYKSINTAMDNAIEIANKNPALLKGNDYPTLRKGSQGPKVANLALALVSKGYLDLAGQPTPTIYDDDIVKSVKLAQKNLGLKEDGVAGPQLFIAMGIGGTGNSQSDEGLTKWKEKINALMEEAKEEGRSRIIIVNIPSYTLKAIDVNTGEVVIESKIVIGKSVHETPMDRIDVIGLKYNPNWTPPMSVIKRNVINNLSNSNPYVRSHGLKAVDYSGNAYPLTSVSRSDILAGRYRVQQAPGTGNSLGVLKFETNSPDNIYLHDTNQRYLFNNTNRSDSLGCIRVQQWYPLAQFVSSQTGDTIKSNLDKGKTYIQKVDKVPVFITYSLYDVVQGQPGKFKDIYNKGGSLL